MSLLVDKGIFTNEDMESWVKLRNSIAHPRIQVLASRNSKEETARLLACLGIFYKLILGIYDYNGAYTKYHVDGGSEVTHLQFKND